jgi:tetratricopeptide (TPR) repeat protein
VLTVALAAAVGLAPAHAAAPACGAGSSANHALTAEFALARGEWPQAASSYACAAMGSADAGLAERATRVAFENFQLVAAERSARRWLELEPSREEARRFLATSLLRLYRTEAATAQFEAILDTAYTDRAQGYTALLATLSEEDNNTGAALVMERLAGADPGLAEAQYARSVLWQQAEHGTRALEAARRAIELRPGWRMAELAEVRALLLLGRTDEGLARAAALAADGDPLSTLNHAWLLVGARRDEEARAAFESLRRTQVAVPQALEGLGTLAYARRDLDAASRAFSELAQASQGDETALAYLGFIADDQGRAALAVRYLERVTTGPRAVPAQLRAYRLMDRLGAPERAELVLADFLEQSPDSVRDVVVGRANQLADAGRPNDAVALLQRSLRYYPDDDDLRLAQAFLLERLDRVPAAVKVMRDVLERRPDDPTALNSLGYTLVDRAGRVQEGHELILRALESRPDSYAIIDSAGWALFRLKRNAEALGWLERAWERSRDPEVAAHLGEVLWAEGRRDEARRLWDEARADAPDNRSLQRAMERHAD